MQSFARWPYRDWRLFRLSFLDFFEEQPSVITIRRSTAADGERAVQIWRGAVDATHDFLSPHDRLAIEGKVIAFLPSAPLWLAVDQDELAIGFMLLNEAHIEGLFIDPGHRGTGIGRSLVEHALGLHASVSVDVNEQNAQAIGFYHRLGFVQFGRSAIDDQGRPHPLLHLRTEIPAFSRASRQAS